MMAQEDNVNRHLIRDIKDLKDSIRGFHAMFSPDITGATDVDFFYERHGRFLIMDEKEYKTLSDNFALPFGQFLAYYQLVRLNPQRMNIWYIIRVGESYFVYRIGAKHPNDMHDFNDYNQRIVKLPVKSCEKYDKSQFRKAVVSFVSSF